MGLQPENKDNTARAGLYIHVPFCVRKCRYCDFYSTTDLNDLEAFVDGLIKEMALLDGPTRGPAWVPTWVFDTIYLGGGTPSVLAPSQIRKILDAAYGRFVFSDNLEITIEANPGTLSSESLDALFRCGIHRFNIGVQSFNDERLGFLGRRHSASQAREAINMARNVGVVNLGLDLIYGLPGQTPSDWLEDLKEAIGYAPEHLSCYMLTYEKGTPLHQWLEDGRCSPLEESLVRELFDLTMDFLAEKGYEQYEISNFSREKAFRSRHNQKYWNHTPYLGLGPSAHSFFESKRWWNHASLIDYLRCLENGILPVLDSEILTKEQRMLETVFLGLRTARGVNLGAFKEQYHVDFMDKFASVFNILKTRKLFPLIYLSPDYCALTREGRAYTDTISAVFAQHIEG